MPAANVSAESTGTFSAVRQSTPPEIMSAAEAEDTSIANVTGVSANTAAGLNDTTDGITMSRKRPVLKNSSVAA